MTRLTYSQLGAGLGISRQAAHKLARQGMPVDSVFAAQVWRNRSIDDPVGLKPERVLHARLEAVRRLWPVAREALRVGRLQLVLSELQAALRAVPEAERHRVVVDSEVMDALCRPTADMLREEGGAKSGPM
jgi:hypothetical protein